MGEKPQLNHLSFLSPRGEQFLSLTRFKTDCCLHCEFQAYLVSSLRLAPPDISISHSTMLALPDEEGRFGFPGDGDETRRDSKMQA